MASFLGSTEHCTGVADNSLQPYVSLLQNIARKLGFPTGMNWQTIDPTGHGMLAILQPGEPTNTRVSMRCWVNDKSNNAPLHRELH
eukprot:8603403-Karenia_brevis.AAC.1